MHTNAVDARRAMALVEQADGVDGGGPDGAAAAGRHGGADGPSATAWEREASKGGIGGGMIGGIGGRPDDAAALVRRAKALGVPPLPPDLGAVRYEVMLYSLRRERGKQKFVGADAKKCRVFCCVRSILLCFQADDPFLMWFTFCTASSPQASLSAPASGLASASASALLSVPTSAEVSQTPLSVILFFFADALFLTVCCFFLLVGSPPFSLPPKEYHRRVVQVT